MKDAIIVDIDGTAALGIGDHRKAYEYAYVGDDLPNSAVFINIFSFWALFPNSEVIFLSGRENVTFPGRSERKDKSYRVGKFQGKEYPDCKSLTEAWLNHYMNEYHNIVEGEFMGLGGNYSLHMRAANDYRKDDELKFDFYKKYVKDKYFIHYVIDDRNQVVDMWRRIGLTCFQVAPGDF
jgi:hypothetical protein